jgi:hypothetical protein
MGSRSPHAEGMVMVADDVSRRGILRTALAAPVLALAPAARLPDPRNRMMVQGRPQDTGSPYKLRPILTALDALGGIRKMRCRIPYQGTPGWATYVGLARAGVTFSFTLSTRPLATTIQDLTAFARIAPGAIWAIEFPNEPDLNPVTYAGKTDRRLGVRTGDAPALIAFCTEAHRLLRATPELRTVPIIAFNDYMQRQQIGLANYGNSHIYPKQFDDVDGIITRWRDRVRGAGFHEGVITEWGRTTGGGSRNFTVPPVSVDQQGELLASDIKRWLAEPMLKTISIYELFSWSGNGEMENFGLFDRNVRPRPAAILLQKLLT